MASAPALSLADAVSRLCTPDPEEAASVVGGASAFVVDLCDEGRAIEPDAVRRAAAALASLPLPTLALRPGGPAPTGKELEQRFDIVLDDPTALGPLLARVEANPLAAAALVQLLRHGEGRDVEAGLVAESFVYSTLQAGPEFAAWRDARAEPRPRREPARPPVRVWRELDRLQLRLDRPEKRNAFSAGMRDALCEGLALAVADASLARIVLSGEGPDFSSGGDLDEFGTLPDPATAHAIRTTRSPARLLHRCAARVRAELHGACIGAGIELPAFAARVVAREDAFVALPEIAMGLVPGAGGSVSLPRRIGRQRTAWLALSGERIDAATALAWGLFDEVAGR